MNIVDIIERKKYGNVLDAKEIDYFVQGYSKGEIPDYQISALLMAIWFRGMNKSETAELTLSMVRSGKTVDLSKINGIKVDKHSSGGVADTVSLPLVALVAANGVPVAKMSGRGLGHTGGTIDKLESIPGFQTEIPTEKFIEIVNRVGGAIVSQSGELVIADKKMYALRDVTGTVDSIPLIASSIMSKKIAAGADAIVLDVKVGDGAFMKDLDSALELAKTMVEIGDSVGRNTVAYITDMNQPLGDAIGNSIEVEEAVNVLKGKGGKRLVEVIKTLGGEMLCLGGKAKDSAEGKMLIEKSIENGAGLKKFAEIVKAQGGDPSFIDDFSKLPQAKFKIPVSSKVSGYIKEMETENIGKFAAFLGAGRMKKGDKIDLAVGIMFPKKVGDKVEEGETIATILANDKSKGEEAAEKLLSLIKFSENPVKELPLIYYKVSEKGVEKLFNE
ncbi:MAG: pyrimidine-nucleoside phosphorylase [Caldisericaceae bacterium]|nr:pyrimidine-nucleoside phosphorylase [Caldisericaceae bacterium]